MEKAADDHVISAEQYVRLPDDDRKHELQAGTVVSEPQPFPRHARVQAALTGALVAWTREHDAGVVLTDCGFLLSRDPDTVRAPDIAFVRRERYDPSQEHAAFLAAPPTSASRSSHRRTGPATFTPRSPTISLPDRRLSGS